MATDGTQFERRADYDWGRLTEDEADGDPLVMLKRWMAEAEAANEPEPNAMVVATVDGEGRPHARNVLLRGIGADRRLWFFTNHTSAKAYEIDANPGVALLFSWLEQHRQIRVEGTVARLGVAESDAYWDGRPYESRLSAVASPQSEVIASREQLEGWVDEARARYGDGPIPRPPEWGGYAVTATTFEFWQGRKSRLHDRLRYRRSEPHESPGREGWVVERLAP